MPPFNRSVAILGYLAATYRKDLQMQIKEIVATHSFNGVDGALRCPKTRFTIPAVDKSGVIPPQGLPWVCACAVIERDSAGIGVGVITALGAEAYALREAWLAARRAIGNR